MVNVMLNYGYALLENEKIGTKDFIRTESYSLRLKPSGAKKVTEKL
jgi:CRISPR-associated protein Cas1